MNISQCQTSKTWRVVYQVPASSGPNSKLGLTAVEPY